MQLRGDLSSTTAQDLRSALLHTIIRDRPGRLLIDLQPVDHLDPVALIALVSGYLAATEHGVTYQATGAHDQPHRTIHNAGLIDVLADSDDLGSLLLAVMLSPTPQPRPPG